MAADPTILPIPNRSDLASFIKDPKTLNFFEQFVKLAAQVLPELTALAQQEAENAQTAANNAQDTANNAQDGVDQLAADQYVIAAPSPDLINARVMTAANHVSFNTATAGQIKIIVDALAILNTVPVVLTEPLTTNAGAAITGGLETDTLRIDQAETVAVVTSDRWIPVNIGGTVRKLLLAS
jgi:hypothetical protein